MSEVIWLDTYVHSQHPAHNTYVQSTASLDAGVTYTVVVTGNYTVYPEAVLTPVHTPIVTLSPSGGGNRDSSGDAEVWYAEPVDSGRPSHYNTGLVFDTGDGAGFVHVEPIGGPFAAVQTGHLYTYSIVGAGYPLKAAIYDTPINDNNGQLRVEIGLTGWWAGKIVGFQ